MKKILFITAFPPSENAAAEKNTMLMLKDLGQLYTVDLIYFRDANQKEYEPPVDTIKVRKVVMNSWMYRRMNALINPFVHPIFTVRFNSKLKTKLQELVDTGDYSVIIFDHSQTFMYAQKLKFNGPKILICHDVEAQRFERTSNKLMAWICRVSEQKMLKSENAIVFAFCQKDIDLIQEYYGIAANLNLDYIDERITDFTPKRINDAYILFGNWKRADNHEGALWLLNGIGDYLKSPISIKIIGKSFPMEKIKFHHNVVIDNLGFVDNPYPIIAESKAMLCPLLSGAGIKVKVIESLASGTPVIGTDIAFEGFSEEYQEYMLRCTSLKDFAVLIETIKFDLQKRIGFKGMFVNSYQSQTIPGFLKDQLKL